MSADVTRNINEQLAPGASAVALVVDDDPFVRQALRELLEENDLTVVEAGDGKTALDIIDSRTLDLVLLDLELPRVSGEEVLRRLGESGRDPAVIIVSGRGSIQAAVRTTKLGAIDFLEKPVDADQAMTAVRNALARTRVSTANGSGLMTVQNRAGIVGSSAVTARMLDQMARAARSDAKVLLFGESGTGKELVARAIHANSGRCDGPFVPVNCAAIPEALIESELFGHERGAFSGAVVRHRGRLELAHSGTLFLDEIGDMTLMTQAKVLRVLEERRLYRVGSERPIDTDFRVVAATHRDLAAAVSRGDFREDLYYRLNVVTIDVPSLRSRLEDVPELARAFARSACREQTTVVARDFTATALQALASHQWPGNVRELRNVVERLVALGPAGPIAADEVRATLALPRTSAEEPTFELRAARLEFERTFIRTALAAHGGRVQETADALGIDRSHLWKKMRRLGLDRVTAAQTSGSPGPLPA